MSRELGSSPTEMDLKAKDNADPEQPRMGKWEAHETANMMRAYLEQMARGKKIEAQPGDYNEALKFITDLGQNSDKTRIDQQIFDALPRSDKARLMIGLFLADSSIFFADHHMKALGEMERKAIAKNIFKKGEELGQSENDELARRAA